MEEQSYERIPVYDPLPPEPDHLTLFKETWRNSQFRTTWLTWVSLGVLVVAFPAASILFSEDPEVTLKSLNETMRLVMLLGTMLIQWLGFVVLVAAVELERTGLPGLGFKRIRGVDFAWAGAFFLAAWVILSGLAWVLAQMGMPMSGDIKFLVPQDAVGRVVWVGVSITAGVVEETAFRGYLMTRLRIIGKLRSWVVPVVVSSVIFGSLHAYQGLPGMIVITAYGILFALLYIRTGSIWPGIFAHFFQDFLALFIPQ